MIKYFLTIQLLLAFSLVNCMQPKTYGKSRSTLCLSDISNRAAASSSWKKRPIHQDMKKSTKKPTQKKVVTPNYEELNKKYNVDNVTLKTEKTTGKDTDFMDKESIREYIETTKTLEEALNIKDRPMPLSSSLRPLQREIIEDQRARHKYNTLDEYNQWVQEKSKKIRNAPLTTDRNLMTPAFLYYEHARPLLHRDRDRDRVQAQAQAQIYGTPLK